jgi:DNA-binding MarR family transcriptional regulator
VADRTDLTPAAGDRGAGDEGAGDQAVGDQAGTPGAERWLDPSEMKAWLAFLEVSHLLERAIEQQLRQDAGLSHAQYEILSRLEAAAGGRLRMSELADVIVVSRSGLTYQISQLEKAGLVRREKCPSDERGILAILTPAGRDALTRAAPGHLRVVRDNLIDALTPAQREALAEGLSAARARLRLRAPSALEASSGQDPD